jgi:hypothetical protein
MTAEGAAPSSAGSDVASRGGLAFVKVEDPHTSFEARRTTAEPYSVLPGEHGQHVTDHFPMGAQDDPRRRMGGRRFWPRRF